MPDSMYKVVELIGSSKESWEKAAKSVVEEASICETCGSRRLSSRIS